MSMLNAHTASNGALMITACVERNGGFIPFNLRAGGTASRPPSKRCWAANRSLSPLELALQTRGAVPLQFQEDSYPSIKVLLTISCLPAIQYRAQILLRVPNGDSCPWSPDPQKFERTETFGNLRLDPTVQQTRTIAYRLLQSSTAAWMTASSSIHKIRLPGSGTFGVSEDHGTQAWSRQSPTSH
jgi:hypothetical protein